MLWFLSFHLDRSSEYKNFVLALGSESVTLRERRDIAMPPPAKEDPNSSGEASEEAGGSSPNPELSSNRASDQSASEASEASEDEGERALLHDHNERFVLPTRITHKALVQPSQLRPKSAWEGIW